MDTRNEELDVWTQRTLETLDPEPGWQPSVSTGLAKFRAGRKASKPQVRWPLMIAAAALLFLSLPMAGGARGLAQRCIQACVQLLSRSTATPPAIEPATASQPFIEVSARRPAPDFAFDDVLGRPVRSSSFKGQIVLLNFWATWCPPCKVEMPWFADFATRDASRGLGVVGIAMDEDGVAPVRAFVEAKGVPYAVGLGNDQIGRAFGGVENLPTTFLLDRRGRIAGRFVGLTSQAEYQSAIDRLLAER
jgi:cytochrome c biogenesis protein CcmG/thiol:disulfide interchange protein DsbE